MQVIQTMQRAAVSYMFSYQSQDEKMFNPHYSIRLDIQDLTPDNFSYIAGDAFTIISAFLTLFFGSATDLMNRKLVLCGSCAAWCILTYLSGFVTNFHQLLALRILIGFFQAVSGPCSYSLITDWIPPENRTMAYSLFALGV
jgi:MFS family permease